MAVHFMFASSKQFDSVPVAGNSIPLGQLKDEIYNLKFRAALEKQRIKEAFDFRVYDAETKEEIVGDHTRVLTHSRVFVKRVPAFVVSQLQKQQLATQGYKVQEPSKPGRIPSETVVVDDGFGDDVYSSTPSVTVSCVSSERDSSGISATSGLKEVRRIDEVSANTVKPVRPKVERDRKVERNRKVARVVTNTNLERVVAKPSPESAQARGNVIQIPPELACSLCHHIMKDSVLIPCCCNSFCRNCVTTAILEQQKCPKCGSTKCKDSNLLPNRHVNNMVYSFLKSNGIASDELLTAISSNGSNGASSQSLQASKDCDSSLSSLSGSSQIIAAPASSNVCEKRKLAPLCNSLNGAKKAKPLQISLAGAKA